MSDETREASWGVLQPLGFNKIWLAVSLGVGMLATIARVNAQSWTLTTAPATNWVAIASSADGHFLAAVSDNLAVYTSTNSGGAWQTNPIPSSLRAVACSADGSVLVAGGGGGIATSTNLGTTWSGITNLTPEAIATSADGTRLVAVTPGPSIGFIYTSTDSGITWKRATNGTLVGAGWNSVASSADGTKLVAVPSYGAIYTSTDSGATWVSNNVSPHNWHSVASSADGSKLIAAAFPTSILGGIYTSEDYGSSWRSNNVAPFQWLGVTCSADGRKLVAVPKYGPIHTSIDAGYNWISNSAPSTNFWFAAASSADGNKLAAVAYLGGGIYTLQLTPNPKLDITRPSLTNIVISWTIPSMNFVLQENLDLATTNWTDVMENPTTSNFVNEVNLPIADRGDFFRLISR